MPLVFSPHEFFVNRGYYCQQRGRRDPETMCSVCDLHRLILLLLLAGILSIKGKKNACIHNIIHTSLFLLFDLGHGVPGVVNPKQPNKPAS